MDYEIDLHITRLLWREQLREAPRSAYSALRRLLRLEARQYLAASDGHVLARFTSEADQQVFFKWVGQSHIKTFSDGVIAGREYKGAQEIHLSDRQADAGHAGTP